MLKTFATMIPSYAWLAHTGICASMLREAGICGSPCLYQCSVLLSAGMTWGRSLPLRLAALCVIESGYINCFIRALDSYAGF